MLSRLKSPLTITTILLGSLYLLAVGLRATPEFIYTEFQRVVVLIVSFILPILLMGKVLEFRPSRANLATTTLILLLLADPSATLLQMTILGLVTFLIKTILRFEHQPIINPAAAGLLVATYLEIPVSWWGASFSPRLPFFSVSITSLLIIPVGIYLILLYKKLPTLIGVPASLLVVYLLLTRNSPLITMLEGTFAFFLLVMATEPRTTPLIDKQEWLYALLLGSLLGYLFVNRIFPDPYLASLLLMNLAFTLFKFVQLKVRKSPIS